ncbi:MAG: hypothetical protein HOE48_10695 [Candidatus Latescibacteria bacterium]|jgi:hypothetical protein|nr:hypothetical protein [Candidatus Latescibacterota bacterium]
MHQTTRRFWRCFERLPIPVQETAKENFSLLKANQRHPSLHFKEVGKFWSVRAGIGYRALAVKDQDDFIWVWIGPHGEYDRLINS